MPAESIDPGANSWYTHTVGHKNQSRQVQVGFLTNGKGVCQSGGWQSIIINAEIFQRIVYRHSASTKMLNVVIKLLE